MCRDLTLLLNFGQRKQYVDTSECTLNSSVFSVEDKICSTWLYVTDDTAFLQLSSHVKFIFLKGLGCVLLQQPWHPRRIRQPRRAKGTSMK